LRIDLNTHVSFIEEMLLKECSESSEEKLTRELFVVLCFFVSSFFEALSCLMNEAEHFHQFVSMR